MMQHIANPMGLGVLLALFAVGGTGALLGRAHDRFANVWGGTLAVLGGAWGVVFASSVLLSGQNVDVQQAISSFSLISLSIHVDMLSAFFVLAISLATVFCSIYAIGYAKSYFGRYNVGDLGLLYNLFIAAMLLVVTASNGVLFLIAWEIMALSSYCLVVYERHDASNVKAGYVYLILTHIGTAFILLSFMLLYRYTGSFDFETIKASVGLIPQTARDTIFVLAFIGFGTKAGVIPFHIWLPSAHPAAPSHVSALMSGVMIKTGIYMMMRIFLEMLSPIPSWWGVAVLVMGSVSCVLGVLYALTEHDLKRLLAFHSIENIGIILLGLGSAMVFSSLHQTGFMIFALAAALFHTLNHAIFKSLLFLGAGSVIHATHTRNIEKYGGLIRLMPATALFFLVGSMAISALPPLNGFASEWVTFTALFHGVASSETVVKWTFVLAIAALGITGGLALACFVKAFGATFLARPRTEEARGAHESSWWMRSGMAGLAALCLVVGVGAAFVFSRLQDIARTVVGGGDTVGVTAVTNGATLAVGKGFASFSTAAIFGLLLATALVAWLVFRYGVYRSQKLVIERTWDCGTDLEERMEITSTGFARSIVMIFQGVLKSSMQHEVEYDDAASRYTPTSRGVSLEMGDIYRKYVYDPAYSFVHKLAHRIKSIQNGNVNSYILYIFLVLMLTLVVGVR